MRTSVRRIVFFLFGFLLSMSPQALSGQTAGSSGTIYGTVTDPTGAVVPGALVEIENPVSHYTKQTQADASGQYQFANVPLNPYRLIQMEACD